MPGLVPGIHVFSCLRGTKSWMAGSSPAMTSSRDVSQSSLPRQPLRQFLVQFRQQHDAVLVAAGGMHHDPRARLAAFVARRVRNIGVAETLLALLDLDALLEVIAVIDRAFALQHEGDGL